MGVDAVSDCGLDSDPPAMNLGAGAALTIRAAAGPAPALLLLLHGKALDGAPRGPAAEAPLALVGSRTVAGPAPEPDDRPAAATDPARGAAAATALGLGPRAAAPEAAACSGLGPRAAGVDLDLLVVDPRQVVA